MTHVPADGAPELEQQRNRDIGVEIAPAAGRIGPEFMYEQIQHLNEQQCRVGATRDAAGIAPAAHPVICANRLDGGHGEQGGALGLLVATPDGWVCPHCGYTQELIFATSLPATLPDADSSQEAIAALRERVVRYVAEYQALILDRKKAIDQDAAENARTDRVWKVAGIMRAALMRRDLKFSDIEVRFSQEARVPGPAPVPGPSWTTYCVADPSTWPPEGETAEMLLYEPTKYLRHAGFGSGGEYFIRKNRRKGRFIMASLWEGGDLVAWRELPAARQEMHGSGDAVDADLT
jgi:hypothetical protein